PAGVCARCPVQFPAYPNAFFQDEDRKLNGTLIDNHVQALAFSTRDSPAKVRQFYEDALLASGWQWNGYKTYLLRGPESAPEFCFDPRIISSTGNSTEKITVVRVLILQGSCLGPHPWPYGDM
ncbi:MAG: hypothetical protein ACJ78Q_03415, partial [Chloroflexia bacterium]